MSIETARARVHRSGRCESSRDVLARGAVLVLLDSCAWLVAVLVATVLRYEMDLSQIDVAPTRHLIVVAILAQVVVGGVSQTYRGRHAVGSLDDAVNISGSIGITAVVVATINVLVDPTFAPRSVPLIAVPIALLLAVGARVAVRRLREWNTRPDHRSSRRVIVYGAGNEGELLLRSMLSDPRGDYLPVALLDDNPQLRRRRISGVSVSGTRTDIAAAASKSGADLLVIAGRASDRSIREIHEAALEAGLDVRLAPPLTEALQQLPGRPDADQKREVRRPAGAPAVLSRGKRALDILLCSLSLLVVLPVLLLIAAVLKLSTGEVLYGAKRVGRDGQIFTMYKFSTMVPGDSGPRLTRAGDPRITRVGRWLRTTKLNELPQVFNIIKGDMSLVGPRPEDPRYAAFYSERQRRVLSVRPGMTSLAFLEFGDEQEFIERVRPPDIESYYLTRLLPAKLDIELRYIDHWTLLGDLRIIARTFSGLLT